MTVPTLRASAARAPDPLRLLAGEAVSERTQQGVHTPEPRAPESFLSVRKQQLRDALVLRDRACK